MNIVFMGSPKEVIEPLKSVIEHCQKSSDELVAVISQPARPVGRKKVLTDPPLATFSKENNILTLQPEKCRDEAFIEQLKDLKPDLIITAAYGQILSQAFLDVPTKATINIHPSLLPEYRGAIPVPAVLLDGKTETGVSILYTVKALDAGDIISQKVYEIDQDETSDILLSRLFKESGEQLISVIKDFSTNSVSSYAQDESKVSHCKKIDKKSGEIVWESTTAEIYNKYRAYYPWPGTFTYFSEKRVVIEAMKPIENIENVDLKAGEFKYIKSMKKLIAASNDGFFELMSLKPAGKKAQDGAAFWNGSKLKDKGLFENDV